ncbi:MAG TPA: phosphate ABC transporter substrate-binding protein PstS [Anaerolineales bacterium]|nr:phosphate ABC transporter substrate-binding protein PstS [Anaerolineales bacterium]
MRKSLFVPMFVLLAAALVMSACGSAATPTPVTLIQTQVVNQVQVVTATPGPATSTPLPAGSIQITAAGATFPLPLYQQWTYAYQYVDPAVVINYNGIGSGAGKTAIINNTVDFAGSDSALSDQNYADGKDLQMYPVVAGAVVPAYNIALKPVPTAAAGATAVALPKLILGRQLLVDIYNGKVTTWDDPEIVALNPGLKDYLPSAPITTVHRSDASGTTDIFTHALTAFSADWKAGAAQSVQWPGKGLGGKGNAGVAAAILNTPNSIGYVELAYAMSNSMSFAQMVNKAGKTVTANGASVNADMADFATAFDNNAKLTAYIPDGGGAGSWPITGYTYFILHTSSMKDCTKAQAILDFIKWAQTDATAQKAAVTLGYSVLPDAVRSSVLAALGKVTCNGQPLK